MKVYITGKITGEKMAECTLKFGAAYQDIREMGAEAVNPLAVVNDWHTTWLDAMRKCVTAMMDCDALFALPDYVDSKGAMIECDLALRMGIPIYHKFNDLKKAIQKCQ